MSSIKKNKTKIFAIFVNKSTINPNEIKNDFNLALNALCVDANIENIYKAINKNCYEMLISGFFESNSENDKKNSQKIIKKIKNNINFIKTNINFDFSDNVDMKFDKLHDDDIYLNINFLKDSFFNTRLNGGEVICIEDNAYIKRIKSNEVSEFKI